jgi:hypothetical protein
VTYCWLLVLLLRGRRTPHAGGRRTRTPTPGAPSAEPREPPSRPDLIDHVPGPGPPPATPAPAPAPAPARGNPQPALALARPLALAHWLLARTDEAREAHGVPYSY